MKFLQKTKYLILVFLIFSFCIIFITHHSYEKHLERTEYLAFQFNAIVYEFYINSLNNKVSKDYDDDILSTGLIKNMYVYNDKTGLVHYIQDSYIYNKHENLKDISIDIKKINAKSSKIDERFSEFFSDNKSYSLLYDNELKNYCLMYLDIPSEYKDSQLRIIYILLLSGVLMTIVILSIYNRYSDIIINEKVAETVNLFKDTSFIVSNFNHEINTPLTSIESSLYALKQENSFCYLNYKDNNECAKINRMSYNIDSITKDINFIKSFISDISTLKMINGKSSETNNLYESLDIIKRTVSNITTTKMDIEIDDKFKNVQIKISNEYMYSIFINLIKNSYEADASYTNVYLIRSKDDKICIMYRDNGTGIKVYPPESIFNKNISSKSNNSGRGFGMYFIKAILESYDGDINIVKTNKYGTEFRISLPYEEV